MCIECRVVEIAQSLHQVGCAQCVIDKKDERGRPVFVGFDPNTVSVRLLCFNCVPPEVQDQLVAAGSADLHAVHPESDPRADPPPN